MVLSLNFTQVLQLTLVPTLAEAVVESFLTMLDAEEPSLFSSAAQIVELESTAASTVKMLESDAQVVCDCVVSVFLPVCHCVQCWGDKCKQCKFYKFRLLLMNDQFE